MPVKWKNAGGWGGQQANLASGLTLSATYDALSPKGSSDPPYVANVFGLRIKQRFNSIEDAKAAAVRLARQQLTAALKALT